MFAPCWRKKKKKIDQKFSPWTSGLNNLGIIILIPWLWQTWLER
jgi:hypothetical protein